MDTAYILSRFAIRKKAAESAYYQFMAEDMTMGKSPEPESVSVRERCRCKAATRLIILV